MKPFRSQWSLSSSERSARVLAKCRHRNFGYAYQLTFPGSEVDTDVKWKNRQAFWCDLGQKLDHDLTQSRKLSQRSQTGVSNIRAIIDQDSFERGHGAQDFVSFRQSVVKKKKCGRGLATALS